MNIAPSFNRQLRTNEIMEARTPLLPAVSVSAGLAGLMECVTRGHVNPNAGFKRHLESREMIRV